MEILKIEKEVFCKGTQFESTVLVATILNAENNQGQFTEAIDLVCRNNKDLKISYSSATNVSGNIYDLVFKIIK